MRAAAVAAADHVRLFNPSQPIVRPDNWSGPWYVPKVKHRANWQLEAPIVADTTGERLLDLSGKPGVFGQQALTNRSRLFSNLLPYEEYAHT